MTCYCCYDCLRIFCYSFIDVFVYCIDIFLCICLYFYIKNSVGVAGSYKIFDFIYSYSCNDIRYAISEFIAVKENTVRLHQIVEDNCFFLRCICVCELHIEVNILLVDILCVHFGKVCLCVVLLCLDCIIILLSYCVYIFFFGIGKFLCGFRVILLCFYGLVVVLHTLVVAESSE